MRYAKGISYFCGKGAGFWIVHCLHFLHGVMIFQVLLVKKLHTIKTKEEAMSEIDENEERYKIVREY